ncbi:C-type lectin domain family 10 member A-like isoform X1 [Paramisgurnus dabryanus]|uniref:C-type lectin domain family 10 member A-like isoform X1 n=1 Tax=Paramisgurnus dabryanus TaxID=90735 RepID=UPI0031F33C81
MNMNTERMNDNDGPDPDSADYCNDADVQHSVMNNPRNNGKRPFCQNPFKVATACLTAFCLLLLMVLVVTKYHSKSSSVQDLPSSPAEPQMFKTCANVTHLIAELQTLRKANSDLEEERSQLKINITALGKSSSVQDLPSSPAEPQMIETCTNVTNLTAELQTLKKEKSDLEEERSQLKIKITALEASAATKCTPVTATGSCPVDWHYFEGSCYYISEDSERWPESQAYCKLQGGHLAIVTTADEQTFIWNLLPRGHWNAFWIGLTDEETEDEWRWVDGTKLVGGFWEDGEPNNHINEDCGNMVKTTVLDRVAAKSWYDAPCHMSRRFICEKKADVSS